jgi:selenocysteine-specific elongation factor
VRAASSRALPDAKIVSTSSVSGVGIGDLRAEIGAIARSLPARGDDDLFRMPVDRSFTIRGTGTVVTGTVWSGRLERDAVVRIVSPHTSAVREARVRGVQAHGAHVDSAVAGVRSAIALAGVDVADVPRGATLVTDREWSPTSVLRADVSLAAGSLVEIRPRTWVRFHTGTSEVAARIVARDVREGAPFAARIVLDQPLLVRAGDRFVVRRSAPLNTIAGGVIVDPYPMRRGRLWPPSLDPAARLAQLVEEAGREGIAISGLPVRLGLSMPACRRHVAESDAVVVGGARMIAPAVLTQLREAVVAAVDAYHAAHPLDPGAPVQAIRGAVKGHADVVEEAIRAEISANRIVVASGTAARSGWAPTPSVQHESMLQTLVSQLDGFGAEPPSVGELSATIGSDAGELLRYLERNGRAVQVEQDRYYAPGHLMSLVGRLQGLLAGGVALGPAELREGLGLSRKYLIPFLEYCDRVGYTNRVAAGRVWVGT